MKLTIEKAKEIVNRQNRQLNHEKRMNTQTVSQEYLYVASNGFIEGHKAALESEAVKGLVEATKDAIKALDNLNPKSRLPKLEKALTRFEQFKQEGKS